MNLNAGQSEILHDGPVAGEPLAGKSFEAIPAASKALLQHSGLVARAEPDGRAYVGPRTPENKRPSGTNRALRRPQARAASALRGAALDRRKRRRIRLLRPTRPSTL